MSRSLIEHTGRRKAANFVLGLGIVASPLVNFLSDDNLPQITSAQVSLLWISLIPASIAAYLLTLGLSRFVLKRVEHDQSMLFVSVCLGFYLQFFYQPLKVKLQTIFQFSLVGSENLQCQLLTLFTLLCIWLVLTILAIRNHTFIRRILIVFVATFLGISIFPSVKYVFYHYEPLKPLFGVERNVIGKTNVLYKSSINSSNYKPQPTGNNVPNIYFVILDGMMSLENASALRMVDKADEKAELAKLGVRYIGKSVSSYDGTGHTIASIFNLDYYKTLTGENTFLSKFPFNLKFPRMLKESEAKLPVFDLLNSANTELIWQGNIMVPCTPRHSAENSESNNWKCARDIGIEESSLEYKLTEWVTSLEAIYTTSIIGAAINRFRTNIGYSKRSLNDFSDKLETISTLVGQKLFFVHHMAPHDPYLVTDTCESVDKSFPNQYLGYRANYICTLKEVKQFLKRVNTVDPTSIVVFQGDHGWGRNFEGTSRTLYPIEMTMEEGKKTMAEIFNAIKAPEECFLKFGVPRTSINAIRFVLNCAYEFQLPYIEDEIHYPHTDNDQKFGIDGVRYYPTGDMFQKYWPLID